MDVIETRVWSEPGGRPLGERELDTGGECSCGCDHQFLQHKSCCPPVVPVGAVKSYNWMDNVSNFSGIDATKSRKAYFLAKIQTFSE